MNPRASLSEDKIFSHHWEQIFNNALNRHASDNSWLLSSICYSAWPLIFNREMIFFEKFWAQKMLRKAGVPMKDAVVLDAGCGTGRWCSFFKEKGAVVIGIDLFPDLLFKNRERLPHCDFVSMSISELGVRDQSLDFLNACLVYQHIPRQSKPAALKESWRSLKENGQLLILDVLAVASGQKATSTAALLSRSEWRTMLEAHGFEVIAEQALHAYPIATVYRFFCQGLGKLIKMIKRRRTGSGQNQLGPASVLSPQTPAQPRKRHLFYEALNQWNLRLIALLSFPLEFLWIPLGFPASHRIFLARKKALSLRC